MVKRTVEISRQPCHLATRLGQMLILTRTEPPRPLPANPPNLAGILPIEDLGLLMVDERDTTYSHTLLVRLAQHGAALVVCGEDHHPLGMYLPISTNTHLLSRLQHQLSAPRPRLKQAWQAIVRAKIRAQAANITDEALRTRLNVCAAGVRSADAGNAEAVAAAAYWPALFCRFPSVQHPFRRVPGERDAPFPNALLDYGYAALRATVARAIVAAGLLPALGMKHIGRSNPYCLADDLVEPARPIMDARIRELARAGQRTLDQSTKAYLLATLAEPVLFDGEHSPLMVALQRSVSDFVALLAGERKPEHLRFPVAISTRVIAPRQPGSFDQSETQTHDEGVEEE